jgi:hypothetical protein
MQQSERSLPNHWISLKTSIAIYDATNAVLEKRQRRDFPQEGMSLNHAKIQTDIRYFAFCAF